MVKMSVDNMLGSESIVGSGTSERIVARHFHHLDFLLAEFEVPFAFAQSTVAAVDISQQNQH